MGVKHLVGGSAAYFVILFIFSGISQALPWGVPSTNSVRAAVEAPAEFGSADTQVLEPHALTTPEFDREMVNKVSVLMTDDTFSWIVSKPVSSYDPASYMAWEAATQLGVAVFLTLALWLTRPLPLRDRVALVALAAIATGLSTYGQLLNWWGLPPRYSVGVALNLALAWSVGALVVGRFIVRSPRPT
jgi:hypothetical protein